jgi:acyl-CoA synthetase (AMP-forming)/AMP-acid ligase II
VNPQLTLASLFGSIAESDGGALLFADERDRYTRSDAAASVERAAAELLASGVQPGDRVAFMSGPSARHAVAYFACQRIGATVCALHLREPAHRLREAVAWLEARAIACDEEHRELAEAARGDGHIPILDVDALSSQSDGLATTPEPGPDDLSAIVMSSGTTGAPKGTLVRQRAHHATASAGAAVFGDIGPGSSVLVPVAPSAAAWSHMVLPFVAAGAAVHFLGRFDARRYVETLVRERVTHAPIVPTMWRMVLASVEPDDDLASVACAFFAGEAGSPELVDLFRRVLPGARVRTGYLSAEGGCASGVVADESVLVDAGKPSSTGRPVPGCELRIVDPDGSVDDVVSAGEEGEIVLRSESLATGYWKDEGLTGHRFVSGWWRSGDVGRVDAEGDVFIVGRTDHVINSGGLKVHAEEVEAALLQHPNVTLAAVVAEPDQRWGQAVVAHVVRTGDATAEEILAFCRERELLSSVKLPKRVYFHESLPLGPTGKLARRALSAPVPGVEAR